MLLFANVVVDFTFALSVVSLNVFCCLSVYCSLMTLLCWPLLILLCFRWPSLMLVSYMLLCVYDDLLFIVL